MLRCRAVRREGDPSCCLASSCSNEPVSPGRSVGCTSCSASPGSGSSTTSTSSRCRPSPSSPPAARNEAIAKLASRALWWFRWAALGTAIFGILIAGATEEYFKDFFKRANGVSILLGMIIALTMLYNVWMVIWPNQRIVIANAVNVMNGGQPDPNAAARRAPGLPGQPPEHHLLHPDAVVHGRHGALLHGRHVRLRPQRRQGGRVPAHLPRHLGGAGGQRPRAHRRRRPSATPASRSTRRCAHHHLGFVLWASLAAVGAHPQGLRVRVLAPDVFAHRRSTASNGGDVATMPAARWPVMSQYSV